MIIYGSYSNIVSHTLSAITLDSDAGAFNTAAGITDPVQRFSLNQFVLDLKEINDIQASFVDFATPANSLLKACYPFIGGTAAKHKFNLINPADSDAAFRLTYSGGITHDNVGMLPNGSTGFADTKLSPLTEMDDDSHGIDYFLNGHLITGSQIMDFGSGGTAAKRIGINQFWDAQGYRKLWDRGVAENDTSGKEGNQIGLNSINRTSVGIGGCAIWNNGRKSYTNAAEPAGELPAETITFGKMNGVGFWSNSYISYGAVRNIGLSDAAMIAYTNAVVKLQLNLNRCPLKNIIYEGHSMVVHSTTSPLMRMHNQVTIALNSNQNTKIFEGYPSAVSSSTVDIMKLRYTAVKALLKDDPMQNILPVWIGINEMRGGFWSGTAVWNNLKPYVQTAMADGWTVILLTPTKVYDLGAPVTESERVILRDLMLNDKPVGCYAINLDLHAEFADAQDVTYFVDGLHMTDAGYTIVANDLIALINTL